MRTKDSHVLLLSPRIELSPLYYHYLIYHLLEYKYSTHGRETKNSPHLMGISLELPTHFLNDSEPLVPPLIEKPPSKSDRIKPGEATPFLWQAPNGNAALYFGDKWMEFHSFLSARLSKPPTGRAKLISKKHPSWLEFLLELMRARRYSLLYPTFSSEDEAIATVHDEVYQVPEEFPKEPSTPAPVPELNPAEPLSLVYEKKDRPPPNTERPLSSSTLLSILPNDGDLPEVYDLPLLSFDGSNLTQIQANDDAWTFTEAYRREIGGCVSDSEVPKREPNSAIDLFCHLDQVYDPLTPLASDPRSRPTYQYHVSPASQRYNNPVDEDIIPAVQTASAKKEASEHLARQAGKAATTVDPPKDDDDGDDSNGKGNSGIATQNESETQTKKDNVQAEPEEGKKKEAAGDKAADKAADEGPTTGLEKEKEKQKKTEKAEEDPKSSAAPQKGPGW